MTDIYISARRGAGAPAEILYGTVTFKPTLAHSRSTSIVLPAPTTFDLVDGEVVATNVQPTPEPVEGKIEWAYEVTFKDRHSKTYSFLVGVPDSTTQVNFTSLPRYFETKPPLFGEGPQGIPGEAATVAVGTVTSGEIPSFTNVGTPQNAIFDVVLAKGDTGDTGPQGVPGTNGTDGVDGVDGEDGEIFTESLKQSVGTQGWNAPYLPVAGQLTDGTDSNTIGGYIEKPQVFGSLGGYTGTAIVAGNASINRVMIVAEYVKSDNVQTLFSSGAGGVALNVYADGMVTVAHPFPNESYRLQPGKYIFELEFQNSEYIRVRINGRWIYDSLLSGAITTSNNWAVGRGYSSSTTTPWLGAIGTVMFGSDVGRHATNETRKYLLSKLAITPTSHFAVQKSARVLTVDDGMNTISQQGDENHIPSHSMASITKTINALVFNTLFEPSEYDNDITILAEDIFTGTSGRDKMQAGDIITIREAMSLMLSTSNDTIPLLLARLGGERIAGTLPPRAKFVRAMQDVADGFYPRPGIVANVRASSMLSTYHGVELSKMLYNIPWLAECSARPVGNTVTTRGVDPRTIPCTAGAFNMGHYFPEFRSGKGGSVGSTWEHHMGTWEMDGRVYHTAVFSNYDVNRLGSSHRYDCYAAMVDDVRSGMNTVDNTGVHNLFGAEPYNTGARDITSRFTGVTRDAVFPDSGIYITRTDKDVTLQIVDVAVPSGYSEAGVIPSGFTPEVRVRGVVHEGVSLSPRSVYVLSSGQVLINGGVGGTVRGSFTWSTSWVGRYPASIPGFPPNYELGTDT